MLTRCSTSDDSGQLGSRACCSNTRNKYLAERCLGLSLTLAGKVGNFTANLGSSAGEACLGTLRNSSRGYRSAVRLGATSACLRRLVRVSISGLGRLPGSVGMSVR